MKSGRYKIPLIYICMGVLWIVLSDMAIFWISNHFKKDLTTILLMCNGIFFILCSAFILFLLIDGESQKVEHKTREYREELTRQKMEVDKNYHHLENTLNSITDSFFTVSRNRIITNANRNFYLLTGIEEGVTGKSVDQVFPGTWKNSFHQIAKKAMDEKVIGKLEDFSPILNKWLRCSVFPTDEGVAIYFSDITAEKEKSIQLKLALERYDLASRATGDVIYDLDLLSDKLIFNRQIAALVQLPAEDIPDTLSWWRSMIHPEDIGAFTAALEKRIHAGEKYWLTEYRIMMQGEEYKYVSDQGYLIFDEQDHPVRLIGAIKDIDLLKRSTDQLKRTGEILNKINNPVIISNADGLVIWVNPAFSVVTGYSAKEVLGEDHLSLLYHGKTNTALTKQLLRAAANKVAFSAELLNYNKAGTEYWVSLNLNPIFDAHGRFECYISVQNDITEHKEKEAMIGIQNEKLKAVSWLNSHQIRKPVASILALTQLMKSSADEDEKTQLLDFLHQCAVELDDIILEINAEASGQARMT
jgi:PAS domain S-box-containing protein